MNNNFKKVMSISVSNEVYRLLKEKGNMSSYICELVLKDCYRNENINKNIVIENENKNFKVGI